MEKFIPLDKKSKKARKEYYDLQRRTWEGLNPVTRTVPNGKAYDRNRMKQNDRRRGRGAYPDGYEPLPYLMHKPGRRQTSSLV